MSSSLPARTSGPPDGSSDHGVTVYERVQLVHAAVQAIADRAGVDVIFIKGPAAERQFHQSGRTSVDVDVMVHPAEMQRLIRALQVHGWQYYWERNDHGLVDHSSVVMHPYWKIAIDVHHHFPGFGAAPTRVFDALWRERNEIEIAGRPCVVPSPVDHALILALHFVRTGWSVQAQGDVDRSLAQLGHSGRETLAARAEELGAQAALSVVLPHLVGDAPKPAVRYWRLRHQATPGFVLWWALIRAEPTWRQRLIRVKAAFETPLPLGQTEWANRSQHVSATVDRWARAASQVSAVCRRSLSRSGSDRR